MFDVWCVWHYGQQPQGLGITFLVQLCAAAVVES